ncbi:MULTISPECIES: SDR family oxidoreductase [Halomonas]|uniref:SDR family oxidoreductase n=1 Tax=Halomonas casei TaxID=2742613 RepID=A0ABR9F577_9GAMM|nr:MULTISPECIES: SDR family oxidoreductase [Halomonas]MBE0401151.1 SDR family oxidoreductase [Halomonas casei]PCC21993.1 3-ketoacyl-ACP reductase [Halomonas sp. JB37]
MADPKVALVTGGSRGIGAAISTRLAQDGFAVIVNYAGNTAAAESVVNDIESTGGKALALQADIADSEAVRQMFERIEADFGHIDVLVNNAGIMKLAPLAQTDDSWIDKQIDTNLKGSINTMREAANRLRDSGRIINLSTSVVGLKLETYGIYAATKAAVETLTAILAKELRGRSITVNAVAPGPTATSLFLDGKSDELIERMSKMPPLERLATPDDIAHVVAFLASPEGGWVNGQTLRANGGIV